MLGEAIRDVEEVVTGGGQTAWGKYLIVKTSINVTQPLKRGKVIAVAG